MQMSSAGYSRRLYQYDSRSKAHRTAIDRMDDVGRLELLLQRPPKAQHVSVVIDDLEGAESVAGISQLPMHGSLAADELLVQRIRIVGVDVGVPAGPFVARMVR